MKYIPIDLNEKLFGKDFIPYDWKEDDDSIVISLKSTAHTDICPVCGKPVVELHNTYHRKLQDIPINNKCTYLDVIAYKFDCTNNDCDRKVVMQELPFASPSQRRTDRLNCLILAVSIFLSNQGTETVMKLIGVKVSNDAVSRLLNKISIEDNPDVEAIGIDDVATRKGQTYATAIYDMEDHHMIALLDGRDKETVKSWLTNHNKIKVVTRDRASAYAKAIDEALTDCVQIADRFHLLQNLIDRMKDIFKEELPANIFIENGEILDKEPKKEPTLMVDPDSKELEKYDYDNSVPVDNNGNIIEFDSTCADKTSKQYIKSAENRKKQKLIIEIQKRWKKLEKKKYILIAREFNISSSAAKTYVNMSEDEIRALDNPKVLHRKYGTATDDYVNMIYKMLSDGIAPEIVFSYVIHKGYKGTWRALDNRMNYMMKNNFNASLYRNWYLDYKYPSSVTVIKRNDIIKYLTTKDEKIEVNKTVEEYIDIIKDKYPVITELEKIYMLDHLIHLTHNDHIYIL